MMNRAAVTGPTGFIGRNLMRMLIRNGTPVVAIVRSSSDVSGIISPGVRIARYDDDVSEVLPFLHDIDCFYHLAWSGASGKSRNDRMMQNESIELAIGCAELATDAGCRRFVGAGTAIELRLPDSGSECYRSAKMRVKDETRRICLEKGVDHLWAHIPSTYGVGSESGFVYTTLEDLLSGREPCIRNGGSLADFVNIADVTEGLHRIGSAGVSQNDYYIGSGDPRRLSEFAEDLKSAVGPEARIRFDPEGMEEADGPTAEMLSCRKLTEDTGYRPSVDFRTGVSSMVAWMTGR